MLPYTQFNLNLISKYRLEIMGMATILILICHAGVYGVEFSPSIKKIIVLGNLGVEIFFFMSGLGMANSLKNNQGKLSNWYYKRFVRVLIPYFAISIPWFSIQAILHNQSFDKFICNILTISFWTEHSGAWFVALLLPLYILTPLFYSFIKSKYNYLFLVITISFCSFCNLIPAHGIVYNMLWAIHRLPCYFIGLFIMEYVNSKKDINCWTIFFGALLTMFILRLIDLSSGWLWPAIFIFIIFFCLFLEKNIWLLVIFKAIGLISLESYLMNICLGDLLLFSINFDNGGYLRYTLILIIGLLAAVIVNKYISTPLIQFCNKR